MAVLSGLTGAPIIPGSPYTSTPAAANGASMAPSTRTPAVIDGTPVRVAVLAIAAAVGLAALHAAGFRFNVGVSG